MLLDNELYILFNVVYYDDYNFCVYKLQSFLINEYD